MLRLTLMTLLSLGLTGKETINPAGTHVSDRIRVPAGYERVPDAPNSFAAYLGGLKLKPDGTPVRLFNGQLKARQDVHCAVVDVPVGKQDLQQCADAVMRLRGEYLFRQKRYVDIHFNFLADGKPHAYEAFAKGRHDYPRFVQYMEYVFRSANTASLLEELKPVRHLEEMLPGDVFIQKGNPYGHAEIVLDVAVNPKTGKKIFLLAQSYMPAQDIHILVNPRNPTLSPWYELNASSPISTPEWQFFPEDLRRFRD